MQNKKLGVTLPLLALVAVTSKPIQAADGDLVTEFGTGGVLDLGTLFVEESFGFEGPAVQPDGKMVVAGTIRVGEETEIRVLRMDSSGTLDAEFGVQGIVNLDLGAGTHRAREVFVLPDEAILVLGVTDALIGDNSSFIARFLPNGYPDPNFGTSGVIIDNLASGETEFFYRSAIQHDDKLLIGAGAASVYRLLPDGSRDSGFGFRMDGGGRTVSLQAIVTGLAQGDDGFIYVGGGYSLSEGGHDFFLARVEETGVPDGKFGNEGLAEIDASGTNDFVTDLAVGADGFINIVGLTWNVDELELGSAVARVAPDGTPDTAFGDNAVVTLEIDGRWRVVGRSIELAPDGRILIAGSTTANDGTRHEIFVARLLTSGLFDTSFGSGGYVEIDTAADTGYTFIGYDHSGVVLHPEGRLVVLDWESSVMAMFDYELGDLTPETPQFASVTNAALDEVQSSAPATIEGLSSGAAVPVQVSGGEFALDAGSAFTALPSRVRSGQQVTSRHVAAATVATDTTTTLTLGGFRRKNDAALVLGETVTATFVSTTTHAPVFNNPPASASLDESKPVATLVATIRAEDADGDALGYSLVAGNDSSAFSIDAAAELRVAGPLDFESQDTYALTVRADDFKGSWTTHDIVVNVSDIPEPPVIIDGSGAFSVAENAATGLVITTILAVDPEGSTLSYRIDSGNDASRFEIDGSGDLSLAAALDFEQTTSYTLDVVAEDVSGASAPATVTISVTDIDEGGGSPGDGGSEQSGGDGGGGGSAAPVAALALMLALLLRYMEKLAHTLRLRQTARTKTVHVGEVEIE